MPQIKIPKLNKILEVAEGANLMKALLDADLPVASSCDGEGVCAKCKVKILSGEKNLSAENETEIFLKDANNIPKDTRISCQVSVSGDVEVTTSYW